jgi:hypothetical protein
VPPSHVPRLRRNAPEHDAGMSDLEDDKPDDGEPWAKFGTGRDPDDDDPDGADDEDEDEES